jgi:CubicO group peptidase (beta-lactamase class C family)
MRYPHLVRCVLPVLLTVGLVPGLKGSAPVPLPKLDAAITAEMQRQKVPGLALAVVHKGEVLIAKGYGQANVEHAVPVTTDTIFQSGSVGKQFTAAVVMLLVEDGKLSLDDPINRFFPDAPQLWQGITVRHLLTHTSGIPEYEDETFDLQKNYTEEELARFAMGLKLEFKPGSRWNYSNTGYALLGFIIRKASGQFYGDLLKDRVFSPCGMKTARVISDEDIVPHRAAGYQLVKGELKNQAWVSPSLNQTADGALYLSIKDFLAWDRALRAGAVLKPESWRQAYTPVRLSSGRTYPYGFGWFVDEDLGQLRIHHGGAWQGFKAYISRYLGDDLTILVLMNLADANPETFVDRVAELFNPKLVLSKEPTQDLDPALAKVLRNTLTKTREGKLAPKDFSYVRAGYFPKTPEAYRKLLAPLGDPERLLLIRRGERGDDRGFRCRAVFKATSLEVFLSLTPDDRLSGFFLWEEKDRP